VERSKERRTILVVDDEEPIRNYVQAILRYAGYEVLAAQSGPAAISLYPENHATVALLLTDVRIVWAKAGDGPSIGTEHPRRTERSL